MSTIKKTNKLAICGCSFASDFTYHHEGKDDLENKLLWNHRIAEYLDFDEYKIFAIPGSSLINIAKQVKEAVDNRFTHYIISATSPNRVDTYESGSHEFYNASDKKVKDYIIKYFNEEDNLLKSDLIYRGIKNMLIDKKVFIFNLDFAGYERKHKFPLDKNHIGYTWGGSTVVSQFPQYSGELSPNHLNIQGQDYMFNELKKFLSEWKVK